jgi:hypothetical protein
MSYLITVTVEGKDYPASMIADAIDVGIKTGLAEAEYTQQVVGMVDDYRIETLVDGQPALVRVRCQEIPS